jgi:predicted NBD/HSP70 family sugar kinase
MMATAIGVELRRDQALLAVVDAQLGVIDQRRVLQPPTMQAILQGVAVLQQRARQPALALGLTATTAGDPAQDCSLFKVFEPGSCLAMAELHHGAWQGAGDLAMLAVGSDVWGAVVHNGQLRRPDPHAAHLPLDPLGPRCVCKNRGCLKSYVDATALRQLAQLGQMPLRAAPGVLRPAAEHRDWAGRGDRHDTRAAWLNQGLADHLAHGLHLLARAHGVQGTALAWPGMQPHGHLAQSVAVRLQALLPGAPPLRVSAWPDVALAHGAALQALADAA